MQKLEAGSSINWEGFLVSPNGSYELRINSNGGGFFSIKVNIFL